MTGSPWCIHVLGQVSISSSSYRNSKVCTLSKPNWSNLIMMTAVAGRGNNYIMCICVCHLYMNLYHIIKAIQLSTCFITGMTLAGNYVPFMELLNPFYTENMYWKHEEDTISSTKLFHKLNAVTSILPYS